MNIYFAISDAMIEKQGSPETLKSGSFRWKLSYGCSEYGETFLGASLCRSVGAVVDAMNVLEKMGIKKPYTVCQASVSEADLVEGLRASLVGDVMNSIPVIINELTRIE